MIEQLARRAQPILDLPVVRRTRRNHGLEHATVSLLAKRSGASPLMGRSSDRGFILFADMPQPVVEQAVREALQRMRNGEHSLAVHPGCGTSRLTTGMMTSLVAMLTLSGVKRSRAFNRLPYTIMLMMLTILIAEPLGLSLQRYFTTDGDPADLEVLDISSRPARMPLTFQPMTLYTIRTHSS
jgi:hypothetical protein